MKAGVMLNESWLKAATLSARSLFIKYFLMIVQYHSLRRSMAALSFVRCSPKQ